MWNYHAGTALLECFNNSRADGSNNAPYRHFGIKDRLLFNTVAFIKHVSTVSRL